MENKQQILFRLTEIFNRWQELLGDLSEEQVIEPMLPSDWTVKDVVAHMWSWQQASVARAEAALRDTRPNYPKWWEINGPDPEEDVDRTNAWIYEASKETPWARVYSDWKSQFERYLELTPQIPEKDLFDPRKYAWMGDNPLVASTMGALDHHEEHFETVSAWLQADGRKRQVDEP